MASLAQIIRDDRHPAWLVDAIIMSAVVYSSNPLSELESMKSNYGLDTSKYEFIPEDELRDAGFDKCQQTLLIVRSRSVHSTSRPHIVVACRGTTDVSDALTDLCVIHRTMSLGAGAAHSGFLDRAKSIPLEYFRRLLIRGENLVLTGHSLGGAVASLLALRLLEATGKWCHEQVQCYTFGCPFFADWRLAKHINTQYKRHFVHIVSRNDIVPKVMPLAYTLYTLWAGLQAGPLQDLAHLFRLCMLGVQAASKLKPLRKYRKLPFLALGSQVLTFCPALLRGLLHRAIALALSFHSGYGYTFAGHMVLLDPETSRLEHADSEKWTMEKRLSFHFGFVSLDVVKEHSLVSYIENVFTVQSSSGEQLAVGSSVSTEVDNSSPSPKVEICKATIRMKWFGKTHQMTRPVKQVKQVKHVPMQNLGKTQSLSKRKKAKRALRSRVACLIFARRMREAAPEYVERQKNTSFSRIFMDKIGSISRFTRRFEYLFVISSGLLAIVQVHRLIRR